MTYQEVFYVEVRNWYCCILYLGLSRPLIKRKIHISFSAQLAVFFIYKPEWQWHPTPQKNSLDFFSTSFSPQASVLSHCLHHLLLIKMQFLISYWSLHFPCDTTKSCWFYLQGLFGFVWAHALSTHHAGHHLFSSGKLHELSTSFSCLHSRLFICDST